MQGLKALLPLPAFDPEEARQCDLSRRMSPAGFGSQPRWELDHRCRIVS